MIEIKNFADVHDALRGFYGAHANGPYTLDRMRDLMKFLGDPQNTLRVIHVAGTSGKTSTAYFIASLLMHTGAKVGLTVSPHIDEVNERVQIDMQPVREVEFCSELSVFLELIHKSGITPSYFECMVAFAYWEFARQGVDYAVVEVGLGGLLDGTNIASRRDKVCVITDIGLDHTEILGDTLGAIARQKAGIIHADNAVFMQDQPPEVLDVVHQVCVNKNANVTIVARTETYENDDMPIFQQHNFYLAQNVVQYITTRDNLANLTHEQLAAGKKTYIPARMEIIKIGGKAVIIDGAHNSQKLATLFESVQSKFPDKNISALIAFVEGDPVRLHGALDVIMQNVSNVIVTSFYTEKDYPKHSVAPEVIVEYCHSKDWRKVTVQDDNASAVHELLESDNEILLIIGSFYLMNHIRPLL